MNVLDAASYKPMEGGASFSLKHRFTRVFCGLFWMLFAAWTPAPLHRWRVFILNLCGANVHKTAHIYGSARVWYPSNLYMGPYACIGRRVNCYNMAPIRIGERAIVSQGAHLCAGTHDITDPNHQLIVKPIFIESFAWVAAEAFIGPGVTVGEKAVIGARAVLFSDADANGIYIGNPATLLKRRFA